MGPFCASAWSLNPHGLPQALAGATEGAVGGRIYVIGGQRMEGSRSPQVYVVQRE